MTLPKTFEEFKEQWAALEKQPKDPKLKITCLCGKCEIRTDPLTDIELRELWELLNDVELQEEA